MSTMCQPRFYFYRWKRIFIPISNRGTTYHDKKRFIICMKKFNEFKIFVFIIIICEDIPIFPDIVDTVKHFSSMIFSMSMCHLFNVRAVVEHVNYILQVQYV